MNFSLYFNQKKPALSDVSDATWSCPNSGLRQIQEARLVSDFYRDEFWHGDEELEVLFKKIGAEQEKIQLGIKHLLLQQTRQSVFQSWMEDLLARQLKESELYRFYSQLAEGCLAAKKAKGWIVFWSW